MVRIYIVLLLLLPFTVVGQSCLDGSFSDKGIKQFMPGKGGDFYFLKDKSIRYFEYEPTTTGIAIKSLNSDGSDDLSFGIGGKIELPTIGYRPRGVVAEVDNSMILRIGKLEDAGVLIRLLPDYSIDASFGENGIARIRMWVDSSGTMIWKEWPLDIYAVTMQPDGKILFGCIGSDDSLHLVRFTKDGLIDTAFGNMGHLLVYNGFYGGIISNIAIMSNGKIVIGGDGYDASITRSLMLMRFNSDGSMDTSFNHTGKLYTRLGMDGLLYGRDMCLQEDGKILITGSIGRGLVARFNTDGSLDATFNHIGYALLQDSIIPARMLVKKNKIFIAGRIGEVGSTYIGVTRMNSNGIIDSSFCDNGLWEYKPEVYKDGGISRIYAPDKYIYAWGGFEEPSGGSWERYPKLIRIHNYNDSYGDSVCDILYPNPASKYLRIDIESESTYCIYDNVGKIVLSGSLLPGQPLDVSGLVTALYYLRVSSNNNVCTYKFVKK